MCDVHYDGEEPSVWRESYHCARTRHVCTVCEDVIAPGDPYRLTFAVIGGSTYGGKACGLCVLTDGAYRDMHDGFRWTPDSLRPAIDECILGAEFTWDDAGEEQVPGPEMAFWQRELDEMDARRATRAAR